MSRHRITVPATSANLGPGFDTLGLALDITDTIDLELDDSLDYALLTVAGDGPALDERDNLVVQAYRLWGERHAATLPGARFSLQSAMPVGRGFGSSAACIVVGLSAGAIATASKDARAEILRLATELEGHPDNVAACVLGGLTVAFRDGQDVHAMHVASHLAMDIALFVPSDELRTAEARALIPQRVSLEDAVFDLGRLAFLITALSWGEWERIGPAMEDRLHQPYRAEVLSGLGSVIAAAREAGAYGAALSGGGPSVIALCPRGCGVAIAQAMQQRAAQTDWDGTTLLTGVREAGVTVTGLDTEK